MKFAAMMVLASGLLIAADEPSKAPKVAQPKFEPHSEPGDGQKFLQKFVGDWQVTKAFFPRAGEPVRATGQCHQEMILERRFLQSTFVFEANGKTTSGRGLIGFEPETGLFTSVWTDSRQTRMSFRQGNDKFNGERIVLYSKSFEPETEDSRRSKTITQFEDSGLKLVHRQYALEAEGKERLMMELVMTRKSSDK